MRCVGAFLYSSVCVCERACVSFLRVFFILPCPKFSYFLMIRQLTLALTLLLNPVFSIRGTYKNCTKKSVMRTISTRKSMSDFDNLIKCGTGALVISGIGGGHFKSPSPFLVCAKSQPAHTPRCNFRVQTTLTRNNLGHVYSGHLHSRIVIHMPEL